MSLDVFYPDDIQRTLVALDSAGRARGPQYRAALKDVALAFGVRLPARIVARQVDKDEPQPGADADQVAWRIVKAMAEDPVPAGYACGPG